MKDKESALTSSSFFYLYLFADFYPDTSERAQRCASVAEDEIVLFTVLVFFPHQWAKHVKYGVSNRFYIKRSEKGRGSLMLTMRSSWTAWNSVLKSHTSILLSCSLQSFLFSRRIPGYIGFLFMAEKQEVTVAGFLSGVATSCTYLSRLPVKKKSDWSVLDRWFRQTGFRVMPRFLKCF